MRNRQQAENTCRLYSLLVCTILTLLIRQSQTTSAPANYKNARQQMSRNSDDGDSTPSTVRYHTDVTLIQDIRRNETIMWQPCLGQRPSNCSSDYEKYKSYMISACSNITICHQVEVMWMTPSLAEHVTVRAIFHFEESTVRSKVLSTLEHAFANLEIEAFVSVLSLCLNCDASSTICISSDSDYSCIFIWVLCLVVISIVIVIVAVASVCFVCCRRRRTAVKAAQEKGEESTTEDYIQQQQQTVAIESQLTPITHLQLTSIPGYRRQFSAPKQPSNVDLSATIDSLVPRVNGPPLPRLYRETHAIPITPLSLNEAPFVSAASAAYQFGSNFTEASSSTSTSVSNKFILTWEIDSSNSSFDEEDNNPGAERINRLEKISKSVRESSHSQDTGSPTSIRFVNTVARTNLSEWVPPPMKLATKGLPRNNRVNQLFKELRQRDLIT